MKKYYRDLIKDSLRGIGCPVAHLLYSGDKPLYIVYYSNRIAPVAYSDNAPAAECCYCTVEINFEESTDATDELADNVRSRLAGKGWRLTDEYEEYDDDAKICRVSLDINYTGSVQ